VKLAYQGVTTVKFDGMFHRRDIAHRSVQRSVRLVS
jgi:phosphoribosylamine-glycine ligase